mgnify:CR=1 FL=1
MLNYRQLHYFWTVAKAGGVARAGERLDLTPQTISGQVALLEASLGVQLFRRRGRRLELTETGRLVLSYADEIFQIGGELEELLRSRPAGRPFLFRVGISDAVPKTIAYQLLSPAMQLTEPVRIVCREDKLAPLLASLSIHQLDMVLADSPLPAGTEVKGYSHALGECGIRFFATPELAHTLRGAFPRNLEGAPLLLPGEDSAVRAGILRWLGRLQIRPRIVGEFDDSALMKAFGRGGAGLFPASAAIATEVIRIYGVQEVGGTEEVRERFYAISAERQLRHPAVVAISEAARRELFGGEG